MYALGCILIAQIPSRIYPIQLGKYLVISHVARYIVTVFFTCTIPSISIFTKYFVDKRASEIKLQVRTRTTQFVTLVTIYIAREIIKYFKRDQSTDPSLIDLSYDFAIPSGRTPGIHAHRPLTVALEHLKPQPVTATIGFVFAPSALANW